MTQLLTALLSALVIAASTNASPLDNLLVVSQKIISPKKGDNWPIGSTQYVEWDPTQIPESAEDEKGVIFLGMLDETGMPHMRTGKPPSPRHP
jgi:hypothetical protein